MKVCCQPVENYMFYAAGLQHNLHRTNFMKVCQQSFSIEQIVNWQMTANLHKLNLQADNKPSQSNKLSTILHIKQI